MRNFLIMVLAIGLVVISSTASAGQGDTQESSYLERVDLLMQAEKEMAAMIQASDFSAERKQALIELFRLMVSRKCLELYIKDFEQKAGKMEVPEPPRLPGLIFQP